MNIKERIEILINNYKTELEDVNKEYSSSYEDYTVGCYTAKAGVLTWVIKDLETLIGK